MKNDELLIDVLRAAGHADAAELASKVLAHNAPPEEKPADEPAETPAETRGHLSLLGRSFAEEDARRAEGQTMIDQMRRQGIIPAAAPEGDAA